MDNVQHFTLKGEMFWGIETLCLCAVNCYALISGYVGINSKHKYVSLISLCLQLVFYALLITGAEIIVAQVNGIEVSLKTIVLHLLPSIKSYWYFSAYFCLFFFMPLLNYVIHNIRRDILKKLAIVILIIFCGWNLLMEHVSGIDAGYSFLWLAILYALGGYFAKYKTLEKLSLSKSFIGYVICVTVTIVSKLIIALLYKAVFGELKVVGLLMKYNSPTILLAAIFLLSAFSKMKFGKSFTKIISVVSPLAFGVYLIHCHPYVFGLLGAAFVWIVEEPIYLGILYLLACTLAIFAVCLILDWIRSLFFRVFRMKQFAGWIEKVIGVVIGLLCKLLRISLNEEELSVPTKKNEQ